MRESDTSTGGTLSAATAIPIPAVPNPLPTYPDGRINYTKLNEWAGIFDWAFTTHRMKKGGRSHALDNKYRATLNNGRAVTGAYISLHNKEWRVTCTDGVHALSIECKLSDCPAAQSVGLVKAFADLPALSDS